MFSKFDIFQYSYVIFN